MGLLALFSFAGMLLVGIGVLALISSEWRRMGMVQGEERFESGRTRG